MVVSERFEYDSPIMAGEHIAYPRLEKVWYTQHTVNHRESVCFWRKQLDTHQQLRVPHQTTEMVAYEASGCQQVTVDILHKVVPVYIPPPSF